MQEATKSEPTLTEGAIVGHMVRLAIPASTGMIFKKLIKAGITRGIKTVPQYAFFNLVSYSHC